MHNVHTAQCEHITHCTQRKYYTHCTLKIVYTESAHFTHCTDALLHTHYTLQVVHTVQMDTKTTYTLQCTQTITYNAEICNPDVLPSPPQQSINPLNLNGQSEHHSSKIFSESDQISDESQLCHLARFCRRCMGSILRVACVRNIRN